MPDTPAEPQPPAEHTPAAEPGPAAELPEGTSEAQGRTWSDIGRDLLRPSRSQVLVGIVLLLCGLAVTMQLTGSPDRRYSTLRQDDLVAILDDVTSESRRLETEIAQLQETRDLLQSGVDASAVAREEARRRLDALELLGGTAPAVGPGIRVTIADPERKVTTEILLNAIEELRDAGAEVIELDDRIRLVAGSWVGSVDGGLAVDGVRLQTPITIEAIGDPETLSEATRFRGGLVSTIEGERVGGRASVEELDEVRIDSVVTPRPLRFARPA